jgi:hypothetical protein
MRRFLALFMLLAGLIGAGASAFACAAAGAAGDCCPANSPSGCTPEYEQFAVESSVCCITATAPAQIVAAEPGRELQLAQGERGSADPIVPTTSPVSSLDPRRAGRLAVPLLSARYTDASLTYLHTGRLRL